MSEQMKPEYSNNVAKKVAFPNPLKKDIKSQPVDISFVLQRMKMLDQSQQGLDHFSKL